VGAQRHCADRFYYLRDDDLEVAQLN
jgi:hypothetical protein